MTKRKPLEWFDSAYGPVPACAVCAERLFAPGFVEAAHSVAIEHAGSSASTLARRALGHFHATRHREAAAVGPP